MQEQIDTKEKDVIYAALKLIENLYTKGAIKRHIFENILNEYKNYIDISEFNFT